MPQTGTHIHMRKLTCALTYLYLQGCCCEYYVNALNRFLRGEHTPLSCAAKTQYGTEAHLPVVPKEDFIVGSKHVRQAKPHPPNLSRDLRRPANRDKCPDQ